ncbi:MAG: DNA translocase FtsK 4TM domain-containing protein [Minisyncoccia bacterium]
MPKTQSSSQPKIKTEAKRTILGVSFVTFAILSFLAFFSSAGIFGNSINKGFGFLFGIGKFILPFILLYIGIKLLVKPKTVTGLYYVKLVALFTSFILFLGLLQFMQFDNSEEALTNAKNGIGGGYIGYYIGVWFRYIFGEIGGIVSIITGISISVIIVLNRAIHIDGVIEWLSSLFAKNEIIDNASEDETDKSNVQSTRIFNQKSEVEELPEKSNPDNTKSITNKTPEWMKENQFSLPTVDLLEKGKSDDGPKSGDTKKSSEIIKSTLSTFSIEVEMGKIDVGPSVTRFMLRPSNGIKLSRITSLQNDLALAMAAQSIRIEAPIPGLSYVGVETPNAKRATVRMREILESREFNDNNYHLPLALGRDVMNKVIVFPLEKMPHLLIAGATGAGKSMGLNAMILSMLYKNPPSKLKFIFIDPKRVELSTYNGIPHLLTPAIVNPEKAMNALNWCVVEMERRYETLAKAGARNIFTYNEKIIEGSLKSEDDQEYEIIPFIVVVIDELADLMSSHKKEVEGSIVRIAQMARAVGIHLILATQRPSTDVITGLIKANLPSRVSFQVASQIDSRTVLDMMGAEKLLGMGDMLFLGGDLAKPQRIQGPFVPENEVKSVVKWLKSQGENQYDDSITELDSPKQIYYDGGVDYGSEDVDNLFEEAKNLVLQTGKGSASLLQRRLKVGYARAARLLDELEAAGIVGPSEGSKPRDVLIEKHNIDNE